MLLWPCALKVYLSCFRHDQNTHEMCVWQWVRRKISNSFVVRVLNYLSTSWVGDFHHTHFSVYTEFSALALREVWAFRTSCLMFPCPTRPAAIWKPVGAPWKGQRKKGKMLIQKVIVKMWERGVFGSPQHVCSVNHQGLCFWTREMPILLGLETVVTGQPRDRAARLRQTRWRSANIAVNSTSWSPWHPGRVYLKIPEPEVSLHFCP